MGRVYTRTGDGGTTRLGDNRVVPKDARRVAVSGIIDEAASALGVGRSLATEPVAKAIGELQPQLTALMARVSLYDPEAPMWTASDLEAKIEEIRGIVPMPDAFVYPGDSKAGAALHFARTVVRRAERETAALAREEGVPPTDMQFINRLSDYVYALAVWADHEDQVGRIVRLVVRGGKPRPGEEMWNMSCAMEQALARKMIAAMDEKAAAVGVPMAMAVCDADGSLVAFERQANVLPVSIGLARKKAFTAIQLKMPTENLANLTQPGQELWGLHNDPNLVVFGGGIPLVKDGLVVGAVGVSGGSVAEDISVAEAGVACWKQANDIQ